MVMRRKWLMASKTRDSYNWQTCAQTEFLLYITAPEGNKFNAAHRHVAIFLKGSIQPPSRRGLDWPLISV